MMRSGKPRAGSGFTLIEFLLSMIVAVFLLLAVYILYQPQFEQLRANRTIASIRWVVDAVNAAYATSNGYGTVTAGSPPVYSSSPNLSSILMSAAQPAAGIQANPGGNPPFIDDWNGPFVLGVSSSDGYTTADELTISLGNVPAASCAALIQLAPEYLYTYVDGALVGLTPAASGGNINRNILRFSQAMPMCQNGNSHTVEFVELKPLNLAAMMAQPTADPVSVPSAHAAYIAYQAWLNANYARVQNAMAARESAQAALP